MLGLLSLPLNGAMTAQKALQGFKMRELLEGTKDNNILPEDDGSLISPPDKSIT